MASPVAEVSVDTDVSTVTEVPVVKLAEGPPGTDSVADPSCTVISATPLPRPAPRLPKPPPGAPRPGALPLPRKPAAGPLAPTN